LCILSRGIEELCESDGDFKNLIASRSEEVTALLNRYINEIETFNPAYGLVGTNDKNELIIKHILDSLAPLGIISRLLNSLRASVSLCEPFRIKFADAGSGAGLPGIPLAIAMPENDFTLIERMGRRAGFLMNTKAILSLSNVSIEEKELEKVKDSFNLITFRAFKPFEPKLLKTLFKICAPGGIIAAYKGRREKIEAEMAPLNAFFSETSHAEWEAIPYTVPFLEEERHLLVIRNLS